MSKQDEIVGSIERITFQNPENGYIVAKIQQPRSQDLTCIVGTMPEVQPGETVRLVGCWKHHLVHGWQFEVESYQTETPADVEGIKKYLGSGLIKGIGPVYAKRITDKFGIDTLNIIDSDPESLCEIQGIGKTRVSKIKQCWQDQKTIRELMIFLQKHGISPTFAHRIYKAYGNDSVFRISENPYHLARDIFGIGFKTADAIATKIGISKDAPQRVLAGIEFVLSELSNEGHTCFPLNEFIRESQALLEVEESLIISALREAELQERIKVLEKENRPFIWLKQLFLSEIGIAKELWRVKKSSSFLREFETEKAIDWVQNQLNIQLALKQKKAITKAFQEKVHIITGGPGTGKSTITNAILTVMSKLTKKIVLTAPTGRAAKRMTEITGHLAKTIHSLLEYDFRAGGFKKNRNDPLDCDLIIVDEASMIDTPLMYSLLKALPDHCRLILVGDVDQLPSVGPGNVLKDIIAASIFSVVQLNEIFRQAQGSLIITNSHRIQKGIFPDLSNHSEGDFFFIEEENPEAILQKITDLVTSRLSKKYHFDRLKEIQVLSPMKKGIIGIEQLNKVLQESLNPSECSVTRSGRHFLNGDKVMQIRNNYQKEVFNGDLGIIQQIDAIEQKITVLFDEDRIVEYDFSELDELMLAYAASVHKYQGSECNCVIIPIHTTHFMMLRKNLLYTAITRGKKLVILIGTKKALAIALKNDDVKTRHTGLQQALIRISHKILDEDG